MKIDIITLFPKMFTGPFGESIIKRAQERNLVEINIHNLRDWAKDKHKTVDDKPYGGGPGMLLMIQPIYDALESLIIDHKSSIILLSPQGKTFSQSIARRLSKLDHLILICGHYEGFDERIRKHLVDEEISIGEYVLTGGELPAMVVTEAITRLIPGVIDPQSLKNESFSHQPASQQGGLSAKSYQLDYPQYTRPEVFRGWRVPKVLLSGNHAEIERWREKHS